MIKCEHKWVPSEGRTSSGVICCKCWDYNGPQEVEKAKLKVLPNPYQTSVSLWQWKNSRRAKEGLEPVEFDLIQHYPAHEVVYNRVGFYMTPNDCWLEFDMGDGLIKAISYDRENFHWDMKQLNDKETLLNPSQWAYIEALLRKGTVPWNEYFITQQVQQSKRQTEINMGIRLMALKKRIRAKLKELK